MTTRTYEVYKGLPLSDMSPQERGTVIQNVVRRHLEEKYETTATSPTGERCVNGRKRGRHQTTHEFYILGERNEVKNAQLAWDKSSNCWRAAWKNVKSALHDKLLLVLYTPSGLYLFEHDGKFGVTTQGKEQDSCGGKVQVYGPKWQEDIHVATQVVLSKLDTMKRLKYIPLEEVPISTTRTHDVYVGVPLCDASNRGVIIQGIVQKIMEERYGVKATVPTGETDCNGNKRGPNMTTHEFFMLGKRNEVKQAQLKWNTSSNRWCAQWQNVKHALHDVLHLVLYTPSGLYIFEHDGKFGVSTQGKAQDPCGGVVQAYGPCNQYDIHAATQVVCEKLQSMFYRHLTFEEMRKYM